MRTVLEGSGVSGTFVHTILNPAKYCPDKERLVHEINEDDYDRRKREKGES